MKFEMQVDGIDLILEMIKKENHVPDIKFSPITPEDAELLAQGKLHVFELHFTSSNGIETFRHFHPGLAFSIEEKDMLEELEFLLDETDLLDKILKHWELHRSGPLPEWASKA